VIAQFADDIAHGRQPKLYGDGTQTRDFTHVDDVVRALEVAGESTTDRHLQRWNGRVYSFNTLVDMLNEELGTDIEPTYVENPIPESVYVHDTYADITKLNAETGGEPQISFAEGLTQVCTPVSRHHSTMILGP